MVVQTLLQNVAMEEVKRWEQYRIAPVGLLGVVTFNQIAAPLGDDKVAAQIKMGIVISISEPIMAHGLTIMMTGRMIFGSKMMATAHRSIILRV